MGLISVETCCVADQSCLHPGNLDPPTSPRTRCTGCGLKVCANCSLRTKAKTPGPGRWCGDCIERESKDRLYDPFLWRYFHAQIVLAGWDSGRGIGRQTMVRWFRARAEELGLPASHVQE